MNDLSRLLGFVCVALINVVLIAMFVRAILSLFVRDNNPISNFLYSITEPFIFPIRKLMEKFNFMSGLPLDIPFLITYLLLSALQSVLSVWF